MYIADIVVAAEDARFALGYGALGLTADGGNTWFLPRMVGMRRAQELFLLNRRLTAQEAVAFGLVSRLAPDHQVDSEAASLAAKLAAGPTRAFGAVRRMLRQSFERDCPISSTPKRIRSSSPATPTTRRKEFPPS